MTVPTYSFRQKFWISVRPRGNLHRLKRCTSWNYRHRQCQLRFLCLCLLLTNRLADFNCHSKCLEVGIAQGTFSLALKKIGFYQMTIYQASFAWLPTAKQSSFAWLKCLPLNFGCQGKKSELRTFQSCCALKVRAQWIPRFAQHLVEMSHLVICRDSTDYRWTHFIFDRYSLNVIKIKYMSDKNISIFITKTYINL